MCAVCLVVAPSHTAYPQSSPSGNGSGFFQTGKYRNLFAEDGHSEQEVEAKVKRAYQQLFHGDSQTQAIAFAAGGNANGPLMYLTDSGQSRCSHGGYVLRNDDCSPVRQQIRLRRHLEFGQDVHVHRRPKPSVLRLLLVVM